MSQDDFFESGFRRMASAGLRENNARAVLMAVALTPGAPGAQLARITGLGPQSVSRILVELEEAGLVLRGEVVRGQRGKPATPIHINPNGAYCIGCEIGWRHLNVVLLDLGGAVLGEHRRDYPYPDSATIFEEIASITRLLTQLIPFDRRSKLLGIGVAMPSGIARNVQLVGAPSPVADIWKTVDVASRVAAATGLEVFTYNDGNAGCWAELIAHPSPRPQNFAYLFAGTFVGAGIVAEGQLWQGPTGNSANLGSMLVTDEQGEQQFVHLIASFIALERRLQGAGMVLPSGDPTLWDWTLLEPAASQWLDTSAKALAKVIANSAAASELSVAIVDGAMPRAIVAMLVERVRFYVKELPTLTNDTPEVEMGRLGSGAAAYGAAMKPIYSRLFSRTFNDVMRGL